MTQQTDLQHINGESMNLTDHNIEQLKQLFPNVFTEGKIDFDALKAELGEQIETDNERYQFTWSGKEQAKRIATTPSLGTLRPAPDESVNWDSTENLYIEGDNLEVLKLLQKSYGPQPGSNGGKVKMIYIDPPYNTGKDFVYKDDFKDNLANYQRLTGQKDEEGNPLTTNSDSAGRYHSNWLNMMYPRLKLARNLLRDDGVIFISIDDNEVHNLRKICDEIFGEENFVGQVVWKKKYTGGKHAKFYSVLHEYVLVYSKSDEIGCFELDRPDSEKAKFTEEDEFVDTRGKFYTRPLKSNLEERKTLIYPIELPDGKQITTQWLIGKDRFQEELDSKRIEFRKKKNGEWQVYKKYYENDGGGKIKPSSLIESFSNNDAKLELKKLFDVSEGRDNVFYTVKPTYLIRHLMSYGLGSNSGGIILDFFSGSGTTGQAVIQHNIDKSQDWKYILVQIPEKTGLERFSSITEIGKERIRRATRKIKEEHPETPTDLGFKVLKLDTSNIKKWNPNLDNLEADLLDAVDNILPNRTPEDLLYEVLIKYGLPLTLPIEKIEINTNGKIYQAWSVANNSLVACFDENITLETVQAIANLSTPENPVLRVVFRDTSFLDDITKTNAIQRLKQTGIEDVLSI